MDNTKLAEILAAHKNGVRANLSRADLSGANLCKADLNGADLRRADLSRCVLCDANMHGATISYRGQVVRLRFDAVED